MFNKQAGFVPVVIVILVAVALLVGGGFYYESRMNQETGKEPVRNEMQSDIAVSSTTATSSSAPIAQPTTKPKDTVVVVTQDQELRAQYAKLCATKSFLESKPYLTKDSVVFNEMAIQSGAVVTWSGCMDKTFISATVSSGGMQANITVRDVTHTNGIDHVIFTKEDGVWKFDINKTISL